MFKHILCPVDGSPQSGRAVTLAADLAERYGAQLTLLHVTHMAGPLDGLESFLDQELSGQPDALAFTAIGQRILEDAAAEARRGRAIDPAQTLELGDPAERILGFAADQKVDCIVVGRRGLGRLAGLLLGSVSGKLAQLAPCTTVLVH